MSTASIERRAEKKPQPSFNPIKHAFDEKYSDFTDSQLLKEQLFEQQQKRKFLRKLSGDVNTIKWIMLIAFVASILVGLIIEFNK